MIVRDFQSIIGREAKVQVLAAYQRLPDYLVACVGGGSNSIGLFHPFYNDKTVKFIGVEAGGKGLDTGEHSATLATGIPTGVGDAVGQLRDGVVALARGHRQAEEQPRQAMCGPPRPQPRYKYRS